MLSLPLFADDEAKQHGFIGKCTDSGGKEGYSSMKRFRGAEGA